MEDGKELKGKGNDTLGKATGNGKRKQKATRSRAGVRDALTPDKDK